VSTGVCWLCCSSCCLPLILVLGSISSIFTCGLGVTRSAKTVYLAALVQVSRCGCAVCICAVVQWSNLNA
jgi:hypothetical protein